MTKFTLALAFVIGLGPAVAPAAPPAAPVESAAPTGGSAFNSASDLVVYALGLVGVRYKFGGISPETGFDCSGLVRFVFMHVAGLALPHSAWDVSKAGRRIERSELQPGDLVFYNTRHRPFSHVGIYLGGKRFIHAPSRGGNVEIADMTDGYWARRYDGARRVGL